MGERERATSLSVEALDNRVDGRVLLKVSDIPKKEDIIKTSRLLTEGAIQASMLATDLTRGGLKLVRLLRGNHLNFAELPAGNGEAVVFETGLLAPKQTFFPMANRLERLGYKPMHTEHPAGINIEDVDKRSKLLLKAAHRGLKETAKKVKLICESKGAVTAIWAIAVYPNEIQEATDHIVVLGNPLGSELNVLVSALYLGTQWVNRRRNGKDDFDLRKELASKLGEDGEIRLPSGVKFTSIDSSNNGITFFSKNNHNGTTMINCAHSAFGFDLEVISKIAHEFAANNNQAQSYAA